MGGKNRHFGYLHMLGRVSHIDGHIGDVVARERLDALIHLGGAVCVSMKTDIAEVRLHQSGLEVRHANSGIGHIDAKTVRNGLDSSFSGTIDIASRIGRIARNRTDIDNVSAVASSSADL